MDRLHRKLIWEIYIGEYSKRNGDVRGISVDLDENRRLLSFVRSI